MFYVEHLCKSQNETNGFGVCSTLPLIIASLAWYATDNLAVWSTGLPVWLLRPYEAWFLAPCASNFGLTTNRDCLLCTLG
jgi:hypothetical protein